MKKVWVTGSLGMLGSAVLIELEENGIAAIGTDRKGVNITSIEEIETFCVDKEITHIINCAAYTNVDGAETDLQIATLVNVKGPENLGIIASKIGAKLVHFSTDYVFDGISTRPYIETDICIPCNAYGKTKLEGERRLLQVMPNACIIRSSWLFGLNGKNFISKMLELMQKRQEIKVVADQIGRPTFCQDLAEASVRLMSHHGIYHFANEGKTSWYELTKCIYEEAKKIGFDLQCRSIVPTTTLEYQTVAMRPLYSVLDTQKIESILGKQPRSWKIALQAYIKEYFRSLCQ